jgi:hypothetical protein
MEGCCDSSGVLHFCDMQMSLVTQVCPAGEVCGWDACKLYYGCVPPPASADPTQINPIACGP